MDDTKFVITESFFNTVEIVTVEEYRDGGLWMGGYSIERDRTGKEVRRTPVTWNCQLTGLTEKEFRKLRG